MIGLDTNILARYYIEDEGNAEATKQREAARRLIEAGEPLMACKDDRKFVRKAKRMGVVPPPFVPK